MSKKNRCVLIRGGGDLASGVALRLFRVGIPVVITELEKPLAVRRLVSFAEAVYSGQVYIEEVLGKLVPSIEEAWAEINLGHIPVIIDSRMEYLPAINPVAVVDARMKKEIQTGRLADGSFIVGLGPGFEAGLNCQAVIETKRGHTLGRVYWKGSAEADTGMPESVGGHQGERVLRAPADGVLNGKVKIGESVGQGQLIAEIDGIGVVAPFAGVVRGLLHDGIEVRAHLKIGDLDPRMDQHFSSLVSDKALAIGGAVLEALLSEEAVRRQLYT